MSDATLPMTANIADFVPGGIKQSDSWYRTDCTAGRCSRCRKLISDHEIPLMLFQGLDFVMVYCSDCTNGPVPLQSEILAQPAALAPQAAPVVELWGDRG